VDYLLNSPGKWDFKESDEQICNVNKEKCAKEKWRNEERAFLCISPRLLILYLKP
jgi:hypothetical protein